MYIRLWFRSMVACFKIENEMYHTVASIPSGGQAIFNPGETLLVGCSVSSSQPASKPEALLGGRRSTWKLRMARGTPATADWAFPSQRLRGAQPALRPPELVLCTALRCVVSSAFVEQNKISKFITNYVIQ